MHQPTNSSSLSFLTWVRAFKARPSERKLGLKVLSGPFLADSQQLNEQIEKHEKCATPRHVGRPAADEVRQPTDSPSLECLTLESFLTARPSESKLGLKVLSEHFLADSQ